MKRTRIARIAGPIAIAGLALAAFAPSASAHGAANNTAFPSVNSFKAGKYRIQVSPGKGGANLSVSKGGSFSSYSGPGSFSDKKLKGNLGSFGEIDLKFDKSGSVKKTRPPHCHGGKPDKVQPGTWNGKVKFKGEKGYVKVNESSIKGSTIVPGTYTCDGGPSGNTHKYVTLNATKNDGTGFGATVRKSGGKVSYSANESSQKGNVFIFRIAGKRAKASTFDYNGAYTHATVKPGGPFKGTGTYNADAKRGAVFTQGSFSGLKVSFLGDKNVALSSNNASLSETEFRPAR